MEKGIKSKNQVKRLRWFAVGCLAGVAGMWAVCAIGLRVNGTDSEPIGIYWAVSKAPAKGDFEKRYGSGITNASVVVSSRVI
jgi:type IV secretory pathway protease TraF